MLLVTICLLVSSEVLEATIELNMNLITRRAKRREQKKSSKSARSSMSIDGSTAVSITSYTDVTSPKSINTYDTIKVDNCRKSSSKGSRGSDLVNHKYKRNNRVRRKKKKAPPPSPIPEMLEEIQPSEDFVPTEGQDHFSHRLPELDMCCGTFTMNREAKSIIEGFQHEIDRVMVVGAAKTAEALNSNVDVVVDDPEPTESLLTKLLSRRLGEVYNECTCDNYSTEYERSMLDTNYEDSYTLSDEESLGSATFSSESSQMSQDSSAAEKEHVKKTNLLRLSIWQSSTSPMEKPPMPEKKSKNDDKSLEEKPPRCPSPKEEDEVVVPSVMRNAQALLKKAKLDMPFTHGKTTSASVDNSGGSLKTDNVHASVDCSEQEKGSLPFATSGKSSSKALTVDKSAVRDRASSIGSVDFLSSLCHNSLSIPSNVADSESKSLRSAPSTLGKKSGRLSPLLAIKARSDSPFETSSITNILRKKKYTIKETATPAAEEPSPAVQEAKETNEVEEKEVFEKEETFSADEAKDNVTVKPEEKTKLSRLLFAQSTKSIPKLSKVASKFKSVKDVKQDAEVLKDGQLKRNTVVDLGSLGASKHPSVELAIFEDEAREDEGNFPNVGLAESREDSEDFFRVSTYDLIKQVEDIFNQGDYALEISGPQ